jgi:hypothetical protein
MHTSPPPVIPVVAPATSALESPRDKPKATAVVPANAPVPTQQRLRSKAAPAVKNEESAALKSKPSREVHSALAPIPAMTYSPVEINQIIARADKLSGDGNYDSAINLYNTVLKQDSKNLQARRGLDRAISNRQRR